MNLLCTDGSLKRLYFFFFLENATATVSRTDSVLESILMQFSSARHISRF